MFPQLVLSIINIYNVKGHADHAFLTFLFNTWRKWDSDTWIESTTPSELFNGAPCLHSHCFGVLNVGPSYSCLAASSSFWPIGIFFQSLLFLRFQMSQYESKKRKKKASLSLELLWTVVSSSHWSWLPPAECAALLIKLCFPFPPTTPHQYRHMLGPIFNLSYLVGV